MYRMILADDEFQIRKGLASLIPWEEFGIELVGEADNGAAALQLIEAQKPDIAIVDIRMPRMDGLKLLEKSVELQKNPKYIVLSGYDQFEYVRTAMRYGAQNYLLKPVDPEELKTAITDITQMLDCEAKKMQQFDESMKALLNNTLNRLLTNRIEARELREKCQLLDITLRCNNMSVGICKPLFDNANPSLRWVMFQSMEICSSQFKRYLRAYPVADGSDNVAVIIKNPDGKFNDGDLLKILHKCAGAIHEQTGYECTVALGTTAKSFRELPNSYQSALRMLDINEIWGETDLKPTEIVAMQKTVVSAFDPECLPELLRQGKKEEIEQAVHAFFVRTLPGNQITDLVVIKYLLIELVTSSLQAARKLFAPETELEKIKIGAFEQIRTTTKIRDLEKRTCAILLAVSDLVQNVDIGSYSTRVQYTVRYILMNYSDSSLSLKTLADKLEINSAYLGRQFSLETGAFFSDYLNNVRIQRAKYLLQTTPLKIAEIAEQVGFVNVSYFSTVYKRITGKRPGSSRIIENGNAG